jgi:signal transduction histidine kinase/drug/metabolite transporter superfamily protein YnfA
MSPRTARLVSRALVGFGIVMVAGTLVIAATTLHRQRAAVIVFVPADRAEEISRAAAALDPDRDCRGETNTDPALGDAPFVYCELQAHRAEGKTTEAGWGELVTGLVVGTVWLGTGALIISRQPRNTAGWLFAAIGGFFVIEVFSLSLLVKGVKVDPGSVPLLGVWAMVVEYVLLAFAFVSLLFLLYPDGRPPTPGWRWAQRILFLGIGIASVSYTLDPGPLNNLVDSGIVYLNPIGVPALEGTAGALTAFGTMIALGASLSTVIAVRGRFKRSSGEERQQMRWLAFVATVAGSVFMVGFVGGFVVEAIATDPDALRIFGIDPFDAIFTVFALTLVVGIPAAYLIAIFKHGLWELDVVIKKALVALVLTLLIAGLGLLVIATLGQTAFWDGTSRPIAILMGVIAGLVIWPLIRLARGASRRLVFGKRAAPYEVMSEFAGRVGETYATEDVLPRMAQILARGTGAQTARVWLNVGGTLRSEATWPTDASARAPVPIAGDELPAIDGESAFEVRDRGELLGALSVTMQASDPMNPSKERLVRDLASQAGLVLRNVRLIEELRASRQRLVAAQDDERRRIERNLHDGAQQQLIALSVQLRLARTMVDRDPAKAGELLDGLQGSANDALTELRDLARGIYPPLLADQGLAAAVEAQARKVPVHVTVDPDGVGRYPQEIEAAVYFCTLEALNNVAKYAQASSVRVRLAQRADALVFEVHDDGVGFDPSTGGHGTGLQGMADRLDAIGGQLEVASAPGSGTTVRGRIRLPRGSS